MRKSRAFIVSLVCALILSVFSPFALAEKITLQSGKTVSSTVYVGKQYDLAVSSTKVKFYSSNKSVAIVGLNGGLLVPKSPGTVTITAKSVKSGKAVATKKFTVKQRSTSIDPGLTEITLAVGEKLTINSKLDPSNSTDIIKYTSDNKAVASVGLTSGKVKAVGYGETTIRVYALATKNSKLSSTANKKAEISVTVKSVDKLIDAVQKGAYKYVLTFGNTIGNIELDKVHVTRLSTDKSVAISKHKNGDDPSQAIFTLDETLDEGDAFVFKYKDSSVIVKSRITRAKTITVSPESLSMAPSDEAELAVTLNPDDSTDVVMFKSSDTNVVTVDKKTGIVKAKGEGDAQVTVYAVKNDKADMTEEGNAVFKVPVNVKELPEIASARQTGFNKAMLKFKCKTKGITADQLTLSRVSDGKNIKIKSVKKVAGEPFALTVVFDERIVDGSVYKFVYKDSNAEFTAFSTDIVSLIVKPGAVMKGMPTRLHPFALDKQGKVIMTEKDGLLMWLGVDSDASVHFDKSVLTIDKSGTTAFIDILTGETENDVSDTFEVKCVEAGSYCFCEALFPDHKIGDGKIHDPGQCGVTDHFQCDGKSHKAGVCGVAGHFDCDGSDHSQAGCGVDGHFKCDGNDHSQASCGIDNHFICDGNDHTQAACKLSGHFKCDGLTHERCSLCEGWLCVGSHGVGVCWTPAPPGTPKP